MNRFAEKTAIGIITCNRPDFLEKVLESIDPDVGAIYVINSGDEIALSSEIVEKIDSYIKTKSSPTPVGRAKNEILRAMRHDDFEYLFLIEDDVRIKDNKVFEKYIETAAETGLWAGQLSYGTHGGHAGGNVNKDGTPNVKEKVDYDSCAIDLYPQAFQAFTLYHANTIRILGYMDEFYVNAAEHLDHYQAAFLKGLGSYFWYFPDIENSSHYLEDIDKDHSGSVIRKDEEWKENMQKAWSWFKRKYGYFPNQMPIALQSQELERLDFIEKHYSRKDLLIK